MDASGALLTTFHALSALKMPAPCPFKILALAQRHEE